MVVITDSTLSYAHELAENLRPADRLELKRLFDNPEESVIEAYEISLYRKTALIDDKVAAMWGVYGMPLGQSGFVYLLTTPEAEKVSPHVFTRVYRKEVQIMKSLFPRLENYVDASYTGAVRMLSLAGFKIEEPVIINNFPFRHFHTGSI